MPNMFRFFARQRLSDEAIAQKLDSARSLMEKGRLDAATAICRELLVALPGHYELICLVGEIHARSGNAQGAFESFARAVQIQPAQPIAYYKRANFLKDCGRSEEALADYQRAIARDPSLARAFCNQGVVLQYLKRFLESLDSYEKAILLDPIDAFSFFNRGAVLRELNRFDEALDSYRKAILLKPDFAECYCNLGLLQANLGEHEAAHRSYERCIEFDPDFFAAHFNQGVLLQAQLRWEEARAAYTRVIELKRDHADAYVNRGMVLAELRQTAAAMADFGFAILLRPDFAEAFLNRGNLLAQSFQYREAVENYDRAISLSPDRADAHYNRADILLQVQQFAPAIESYDAAFRLDPNRIFLRGMRIYARMNLCDWTDLDIETAALVTTMHDDRPISPPFPALALLDWPEVHLNYAQSWVRHQCSITGSLAPILRHERQAKIRIGYFSGDFRIHPVSTLLAGVIENHDRTKFETIAFSYGPNYQDEMRQRLEKAFDRFLDVNDASDQQVAELARALQIDIAVDLSGYTTNGRTRIFAWRAAPIQASYIGYLGTMGAPFVDYVLADPTIIPVTEQPHYSEKIVYLPSYQANDSKRPVADSIYTREQLGLPRDAFVFSCFNATYKINPMMYAAWMRILNRAKGSVLYLFTGNKIAECNIRRETEQRGIDARRIVFGEKLAYADYLARYRVMDLFLDTLPYNAGTTASDALWAGLPVLTCSGRGFAGRVAASLLTAINLPELITGTIAEYEDLAVQLATTPSMMGDIRKKLADNRSTAPLFNTPVFTRNLEAAFSEMFQRHAAGLQPEHLYVADSLPTDPTEGAPHA